MWIFSIILPSAIVIFDRGEQSVLLLSHKEEEKQETEKKDTVEEKIVSENSNRVTIYNFGENVIPLEWCILINSFHVEDIPIPPPEYFV